MRPADWGGGGLDTQAWADAFPTFSPTYGGGSRAQTGTPKDPGLGGSTLNALKSFGTGALNTLSVPQAVAFTLTSKAIEGVTGRKGMDWSDLAGGFSKGYEGSREILGQVGMDKNSTVARALGLAGDIVLDPLWAVAPVKLAKTAGKGIEAATDAGRAAVSAGGKADALTALRNVNKTQTINHKVTKGLDGRVSQVSRDLNEAPGKLVNGRYFITETVRGTRKKGGAKQEFRIFDLSGRPIDTLEGAYQGEKAFSSSGAAQKWLRQSLADKGDDVPLWQLDGRLVKTDDALGGLVDLSMRKAPLDDLMKQYDAKTIGIKLGFGKANPLGGKGLTGRNYTVRTNAKYPMMGMSSVAALDGFRSWFTKTPVERVAYRIMGARGREMSAAIPRLVEDVMRTQYNLTEQQAKLISVMGWADNATLRNVEGAADLSTMLRNALRSEGKWNDEMENVLSLVQQRMADSWASLGRATDDTGRRYFPQGPTDEALERFKEMDPTNPFFRGEGPTNPIRDVSRDFESAFNYFTKDEFVARLVDDMGLDDNLARTITDQLDDGLRQLAENPYYKNKKGAIRFRTDEDGPMAEWFDAEFDVFKLFSRKERSDWFKQVTKDVDELFARAGFGQLDEAGKFVPGSETISAADAQKAYDKARRSVRPQAVDGSFSGSKRGQQYQTFMAHVKMWFTSPNPQHYINNAWGDFFNSLVEGRIRDAFKAASANFGWAGKAGSNTARGSQMFKLAAGDLETMNKVVVNIGGIDYTGKEIYALSHLMGLGKGFSGDEVAAFINLAQQTKNPVKRYLRWAQRQNMTREDAIRLRTWVKHLEQGHNPVEAMYKTIEGIFDYGDLTNFEKLFLRNILMFYTWMRKNTAFQVRGLAKRPGLYSAFGDLERDRPKMPFEPEWIDELGLIWVPGFGAISVSGPWTDLYRLPLDPRNSGDELRRILIGSLPVGPKQAIELTMNKNAFTGADLYQFEGQQKQSAFPYIDAALNKLGITDAARLQQDGPLQPAVPWWLAYASKQIGPIASTSGRLTGDTGPSYSNPIDAIGQIVGFPKRVQPNPDWERQQAIAAARRKAEETRRRNQTAANPEYR